MVNKEFPPCFLENYKIENSGYRYYTRQYENPFIGLKRGKITIVTDREIHIYLHNFLENFFDDATIKLFNVFLNDESKFLIAYPVNTYYSFLEILKILEVLRKNFPKEFSVYPEYMFNPLDDRTFIGNLFYEIKYLEIYFHQ
jgi:hypothetical protein